MKQRLSEGMNTYFQVYKILRTCIAYSDPGFAGVELVGAVLRQGSFIKKVVEMGWAARYHSAPHSLHCPLSLLSMPHVHPIRALVRPNTCMSIAPTQVPILIRPL